jgi:hypothetical protein
MKVGGGANFSKCTARRCNAGEIHSCDSEEMQCSIYTMQLKKGFSEFWIHTQTVSFSRSGAKTATTLPSCGGGKSATLTCTVAYTPPKDATKMYR